MQKEGPLSNEKILLVCAAGMSTSLLVNKMKKHAEQMEEDIEIIALPVSEAGTMIAESDIVLLGPQVRYQKSQVESMAGDTPVAVIDMRDYGTMNGEAVLEKALQLIK
ncbi:PTS sugar transporter subunit IIB [Bacillus sonorensis]|nr:PTS sugar transporter subunit IIB [Bacillus sonorensis]